MLNQEAEEKLAELLVNRIDELNAYILYKIGISIKKFSELSITEAYQLAQILKYGGSYEEIVRELARISNKNIQDIYKIFEEVAKNNKQFAKKFYIYRGIDYIPFKKDIALQRQVEALANITINTYKNISKTTGIGFLFEDLNGSITFKNIQQSYNEIIDRAVLTIGQGKDTFQNEMSRIMKQMGNNGLVMYESGKTRRLDSAVRMNILDGIRSLNMETSKIFGQEYGADGVEVSVHSAPAPDHADIQGRQFKKEDWLKIENGGKAKDVKGVFRELVHSKNGSYRKIGELNCYHKTFEIVVGVSEPEYTDKQLNQIKKDNEEGFSFEGKKYSLYEGTQLQRRLELQIRKEKDKQILARAGGDNFKDIVKESQDNIKLLTDKYKDLCNTSGLKPKQNRMQVSGYRRVKV